MVGLFESSIFVARESHGVRAHLRIHVGGETRSLIVWGARPFRISAKTDSGTVLFGPGEFADLVTKARFQGSTVEGQTEARIRAEMAKSRTTVVAISDTA